MMEQEDRDLLIRVDEAVKKILEQTTKTNGRVDKLRVDMDSVQNWRSKLAGVWLAIGVASTVLGVVITIVVQVLLKK
jgi:hypothetical protein